MKNISCTCVLSAALATGLCAETNSNEVVELDPVVVTGDLWQSELERTTASVSVLEAGSFENSGSQHFGDLIESIPNLTWTGGTSRPRYLQIRGIGENSQYEGETPDSTVRFLVDDLDFTGIGTVGNLFDVRQVEVLRGPQAGAFGANAAGGVVRIVTNEPTPYWTGQTEATVGNDDLRAGGIAVGGPLLENDPVQLTFRLAIHKLEQNGFRNNVFLNKDDTNERNELTTRLKLRWIPTEQLQFDTQFFYADINNGFDEFTLSNSRTRTFSDEPGRDEQESFGTSWKATWTGDQVEVISTTGYVGTDSLYSFDGDWGAGPGAPAPFTSFYDGFLEIHRDRDVFSQELRMNSLAQEDALGVIDRWTLGVYYENLAEDTVTTGFGDFETDYASQTFSLYGQATHLLGTNTRLTLGLRAEYYDLETEMDFRDDVDFNDWLFGGKLTLEHDLSDSQTAFASVTRGYKVGGANIYPFLDTTVLPEDYDTEDLWNYEIGLRSSWFDGQVTSQVTAFFLDRNNTQLRDSAGDQIGFTYLTVNGEGAQHYGLEAEANWYFAQDWTLNLSGGLLETSRESYTDPSDPTQTIPKRDMANAPSYTYSARLDYRPAAGFFGNIEVLGSDAYFESNNHREKRSAYSVVNATLGYRYKNLTVTLWSRNLLGEDYESRVFFFDNGAGEQRYEAPAPPRSFGVTANYRW